MNNFQFFLPFFFFCFTPIQGDKLERQGPITLGKATPCNGTLNCKFVRE